MDVDNTARFASQCSTTSKSTADRHLADAEKYDRRRCQLIRKRMRQKPTPLSSYDLIESGVNTLEASQQFDVAL